MEQDRAGAGGAASRPPTEVVTCFLRHRGAVLLVRRSARVGSYRGRWGAIAGHVETDDPWLDARREIDEETGLGRAVTLVKRGEPFAFDDREAGRSWRVHPFLFDVASRDAALDWEATEGAWVPPTAILQRDCVPRLWTSYARVAPTLAELAADRQHGATYLSLRALEVLRDRAAALAAGVDAPGLGVPNAEGEGLLSLARALRAAQPAMTALRTRLDRAVTEALDALEAAGPSGAEPGGSGGGFPAALAGSAQRALDGALADEDAVVAETARRVAGRCVLTLSFSGTVADALLAARPAPTRVVVAESRPGREGAALAARLARRGLAAVLVPDAAVAWALERYRPALALTGADTVLPDGAVVNKVGTRLVALAAREAGVPFLAAAARDKVAAEGEAFTPDHEGASEADAAAGEEAPGPPASAGGAPGAGPGGPRWHAPLFERTPAALVGGLVSERGVADAAAVRDTAAEHRRLRRWLD